MNLCELGSCTNTGSFRVNVKWYCWKCHQKICVPDAEIKMEFVECATCRAKTGSPVLCPSCLANRTVISSLQEKVQQLTPAKTIKRVTIEYSDGSSEVKP